MPDRIDKKPDIAPQTDVQPTHKEEVHQSISVDDVVMYSEDVQEPISETLIQPKAKSPTRSPFVSDQQQVVGSICTISCPLSLVFPATKPIDFCFAY